MKNGLNLVALATELERQKSSKKDYILSSKALTMTDEAKLSFQNGQLEQLDATDLAHAQIANYTDIPKKYYDRLLVEDRELLARNVNKWMKKDPEQRMLRTLDGKARALLSDKFSRLDHDAIAEASIPELIAQGAQVESSQITERRMYIKAVLPKIQGEVRKGDVVQAGVAISNSEVGQGSVLITPLIYRLICLNGTIIMDSKFSARHVGKRQLGNGSEDIAALLSSEAIQADDKAMMLKVRDVIRACFSQAVFSQRLDMMRAATEDKLSGARVNDVVLMLGDAHGFNDYERESVLRHLIEGADLTRYGLHNAVTRTAQDVESYDRATELEQLGGTILSLAPTEWRHIAETNH